MVTVEEYKKHLIDVYRHEIDNTNQKRLERTKLLEEKYPDNELQTIIRQTYDFIRDVLLSDTLEHGYVKFPVYDDTTHYLSLNLTGAYFSDILFIDDDGREISMYIIKQFFGKLINIEIREDITEFEEDDIVGFNSDYSIYMQGFKDVDKLKEEFFKPINVIFLDFDGVLDTNHYLSYDWVERRIAILADICATYNCKVVIEAGAKGALDENTMTGTNEWLTFILDCFKKYGIECIGKTPDVENERKDMWKEDEILAYLARHPEVEHYCVIDDDDTKKIMHWQVSDLDKVRDHLVETIDCSKEHPEEEGLLPRHKEEVGKILQKENTIRRKILKK